MLPASKGLALCDDTREGGIVAINQQAVVLRSLEKVALLKGPENAAIAQRARSMGQKLANELKADLDFAYPATGRLAYSFTMRNGRPATVQLEDGHHLQTSIQALQGLQIFKHEFSPVLQGSRRGFRTCSSPGRRTSLAPPVTSSPTASTASGRRSRAPRPTEWSRRPSCGTSRRWRTRTGLCLPARARC
jgi:hypothetical protein